eukprot:CAMPEP_0170228988 /NCGR_PEP_ID=MMETSP0116_2-20130129/14215_1 /TAXON_ID=400756 /ORGANISM="Durinskia baltica, Strain CSIRO CS-38" /LENGTH=210 /DNA_ID=CAMNT_0010479733 /DNA_START=62 /DNA_END=694 /DNA_ORIENTATION=-
MAVVWLHGLGDDGDGWRGAFSPVARALQGNVQFFHPDAPEAPVTIQDGEVTTSWFDLKTWPIDLSEPEGPAGLEDSIKAIHRELEAVEKRGIPAEKTIIGGFSQGGTLSLLAGLSYPKKLAGIVSISGWASYRKDMASRVHEANKEVPVFYSYGVEDPVVDSKLAQASGEILKAAVGDRVAVLPVRRDDHQPEGSELRAAMEFMVKRLTE